MAAGADIHRLCSLCAGCVMDRHRFDTDPDSTFHFDADPDPDLNF